MKRRGPGSRKRRAWSSRCAALFLAWAMPSPGQTPAPPPPLDTLVMKAGDRREGRIVGVDAQSFSFGIVLVPGQPLATVKIPRAQVATVEFAPDEARDAQLAKATPAQAAQVALWWGRFEPYLGVPRSPAGRVGLRYAALLLETDEPKNVAVAAALFARIEREAWSEEDRRAAKQGRLRAMVATGDSAAAVAEATKLAETSDDPDVLIEAKFLLARATEQKFRKLTEDNPRWEEDDFVRPERNRLYHETIDLYLYPYLFFGARPEAAGRSLARLVELYRFTGELQLALETARDLTALYAETGFAKTAATWMASLPPAQKAVDFEQEARAILPAREPTKTNEKKK